MTRARPHLAERNILPDEEQLKPLISTRTSARRITLAQQHAARLAGLPVPASSTARDAAESSENTAVRVGRRFQVDALPECSRGPHSIPERGDILVDVTAASMEAEAEKAKAWALRHFGSAAAAMQALNEVDEDEPEVHGKRAEPEVQGKRMRLKTPKAEEHWEALQRAKQKPHLEAPSRRRKNSSVASESGSDAQQKRHPDANPSKRRKTSAVASESGPNAVGKQGPPKGASGSKSTPTPTPPMLLEQQTFEGDKHASSGEQRKSKAAARRERKRLFDDAQLEQVAVLPPSLDEEAQKVKAEKVSMSSYYDPLEEPRASGAWRELMLWDLVATPSMMAEFSKTVAQSGALAYPTDESPVAPVAQPGGQARPSDESPFALAGHSGGLVHPSDDSPVERSI